MVTNAFVPSIAVPDTTHNGSHITSMLATCVEVVEASHVGQAARLEDTIEVMHWLVRGGELKAAVVRQRFTIYSVSRNIYTEN